MSEIGGIFHLDDKPVDRASLSGMSDSVKFRGPDRSGIWINGFIGLYNNQLITIPESEYESMPLSIENYTVTADSRIDNRTELIKNLEISGSPKEITDSLIILRSYQKWKEDCPKYLLGDFAFVIWDAIKKKLFCARDHLGVKPFYYYFVPEKLFIFSSELKSLFSCGLVRREIKDNKIFDFLKDNEAIDKTTTSFENVLKLPPSHSFEISKGGINKKLYWSFDPSKEIKYKNQSDYYEHFLELYTESVKCRLRSTKKPASMLSGGVDSSSIVCLARNILDNSEKQLTTISAITGDGTNCPEKPFIDSVVNQGGLNAEFIRSDRIESFKCGLNNIFDNIQEPYDFTMNWIALLNLKAKENGCNFIMDGVDGDLAANQGPEILTHLYKRRDYLKALNYTYKMARFYEEPPIKYLWNYGIKPVAPRFIKRIWHTIKNKKVIP
ncbi:MAG: asparagine synthase-related protein, partial [Thermodesulfobacteriota bacterium]